VAGSTGSSRPGARIATAITERFGLRHPILLAPMGDTAGGRLAAAVSRGGGLGMVGGGYADAAWLERELGEAGGERVGVGFITFALAEQPEALDVALDARPVAVQLAFGDPRPFADRILASGAALLCCAQTDEEVEAALAAGADVIVAQGRDAGGHGRPDRGTMGLVPSVVDRAGGVPVVAAGGIVDARGVAAAIALGAAGVSMGTRFVTTPESISTAKERAGLVAARGQDTIRTEAVDHIRGPAWPDGHDGRIVRNRLVERFERLGGDAEATERLREELRASAPDDYSLRPLWGGEGLDLVGDVRPAAELVEQIGTDAARRLLRSAGQVTELG